MFVKRGQAFLLRWRFTVKSRTYPRLVRNPGDRTFLHCSFRAPGRRCRFKKLRFSVPPIGRSNWGEQARPSP
jgi:hypothetical protein